MREVKALVQLTLAADDIPSDTIHTRGMNREISAIGQLDEQPGRITGGTEHSPPLSP